VPIRWLRTHANITAREDARVEIIATDINAHFWLDEEPGRPLARIVTLTRAHTNADAARGFNLRVHSDLAVGGHMGSGAAVSVAAARAIAAFDGHPLRDEDASALAFEIEKHHHGTPSGIDNTVIAYEQPVWFIKGQPPEVLDLDTLRDDLMARLVIADTGFSTPTKVTVGDVRAGWQDNRMRYDAWFEEIAGVAHHARMALFDGDWPTLGTLMDHNHEVLQELGVSCAELDVLCRTARENGALGAKLSGGGRGGNIIALAESALHVPDLCAALLQAGAHKVFAQSLA
jgi:mevalonate kinase